MPAVVYCETSEKNCVRLSSHVIVVSPTFKLRGVLRSEQVAGSGEFSVPKHAAASASETAAEFEKHELRGGLLLVDLPSPLR